MVPGKVHGLLVLAMLASVTAIQASAPSRAPKANHASQSVMRAAGGAMPGLPRAGLHASLDDSAQHPPLNRRSLQSGCPAVPNFKAYPNKWPTGDYLDGFSCYDLGNKTARALGKECAADPKCLSFLIYTNIDNIEQYCFNSQVIGDTRPYTYDKPCQGLYEQSNCPAAPPGYTFYKSRLLSSEPSSCPYIGSSTVASLAQSCTKKGSACAGFLTYNDNGTDAVCYYPTSYLSELGSAYLLPNKCYGTYAKSTPSTPWMINVGGPIMAKTVNVYMIYVGGYKPTDLLPKTLNSFVSNLGKSDWWRINTLYYMDPPNAAKRTYANGQLTLAQSIYIDSIANLKLTGKDSTLDVAKVIIDVLDKKKLPCDGDNGIYVVVSNANVLYDPGCTKDPYCGWHYSYKYYAPSSKYTKMKYSYVREKGCTPRDESCTLTAAKIGVPSYSALTSPTGSPVVDAVVSTLAHELTETVTDPFPDVNDAWRDITGDENADLCNWDVGMPNNYTKANKKTVLYNALVGKKPYLLDRNWAPRIIPKSKPAKQYGCVYGVDSAGKIMTKPPKQPAA